MRQAKLKASKKADSRQVRGLSGVRGQLGFPASFSLLSHQVLGTGSSIWWIHEHRFLISEIPMDTSKRLFRISKYRAQ